MTPAFTSRRRAEEFTSLVESTGGLTDARDADLLELVEAMRSVPPVEARPAFVAQLREQLMLAADSALAPDPDAEVRARLTVAPRRTPRERRLAVAIGGLAIVGATTSMAMAAQTALPGDTLYPLKRAIENARAGVQVDEGDRGSTLLRNASGRLHEVDELTQDRADDSDAIAETLQDFTDQASAASDVLITAYESTGEEASIAELREFAATSLVELEALQGLVPDGARGALIQAVQVLGQIDDQAVYACPTCAPDVTRLPASVIDPVAEFTSEILGPAAAPAGGTGRPDAGGAGDKGDEGGRSNGVTGAGGQTPGTTEPPTVPTPPTGTTPPAGTGGAEPTPPPDPLGTIRDGLKDGTNNGQQPPPSPSPGLDDVIGDLTGPLFP
jgi:hypothetical protein